MGPSRLGLILYFTPAMSARNIVVTGIGAVTREEVRDAARVRPGTPLLQINTEPGRRPGGGDPAGGQRASAARISVGAADHHRRTSSVAVKDLPDGPHLFDRDGVDFATGPPPPALPYLDVADPGPTDPATKAALRC